MKNAELSWLENPEIFRVNRLDAHSDHHFYETEEDLNAGKETLRQSLNGQWRFKWSRSPGERPEKFWEHGADLTEFGSIEVPGHIEIQGFDRIHYTNTMYPWDGHAFLRPPHIDWKYNPVGSYVKEFDLEPGLKGKRVCISFQGVEQAMYLWLNGEFIGYSEDTFTPSEFDLTEAVREKGNRLCVEVYKRSSAAWIEDQDFFRFSGIFREVYLYAKPRIHVEDLWVKAGLREDGATGTLGLEVKTSGEEADLRWSLCEKDGEELMGGALSAEKKDENGISLWTLPEQEIRNVRKWHVGKPELYRLYVRVYAKDGQLVETVPYGTGFRRFEIKDKLMLLNGERLVINGVNRHEWNPRRGRSVTREDMEQDIEMLKKNHINAVRTCHYPNQSLWYQLCDEAGICVMDETNLESHGSWHQISCGKEPVWNVPGSEPQWEACVVDRAASMLERDKNHPSVLWWSCGNESYAGTCILEMSRYFHKKDPSRIAHYEGVFWKREFDEISDVESRMYAAPEAIREYLENDPGKPFLLCEYMHDMGNSIGGMESYIRLLEEFPMYQGGFIWDYMDQALYHKNAYGEEVLGYGGDFGDRPTDYAFSGNGIVFADRSEKPAMQEVRFWYLTPEERKDFMAEQERKRGEAEARLNAEIKKSPKNRTLHIIHGDNNYGVQGEDFEILFSMTAGGPVSLVYDGKEYLSRAPKPAFWRASTENDRGNGFVKKSSAWLAADMCSVCTDCRVTEYGPGGAVLFDPKDYVGRRAAEPDLTETEITYTYIMPAAPSAKAEITYTVNADGRIHVRTHYYGAEGLPELPEFGIRFLLPEAFEVCSWEGLSGETYPDRKVGGCFGVQEEKIDIPAYLVPQECGNHADTCQMQVGGLRFVMDEKPFHFSALPNTPSELENAMHREELPRTGRTVVSVLGAMRGVGGIDSWGADVEAAYHISAEKDIEFSFYIMKNTPRGMEK